MQYQNKKKLIIKKHPEDFGSVLARVFSIEAINSPIKTEFEVNLQGGIIENVSWKEYIPGSYINLRRLHERI